MAQRPVFMEPADVPNFPEDRVDDRQHWSHQLLRREVIGQTAGRTARIAELSGKLLRAGAARRAMYKSLVHEDCPYHAGALLVTIRQHDHEHALGTNPAPARSSRPYRRPLF